jgi:hypothetical protein
MEDRWQVVTDLALDKKTGTWVARYFAVSPDGKKIRYSSREEAQLQCKTLNAEEGIQSTQSFNGDNNSTERTEKPAKRRRLSDQV